jgi:5-dehydro-4-deoxyglucarate dehydratase
MAISQTPPSRLREQLASGLLSFPATAFHDDLSFDEPTYRKHVSWQAGQGAAALFAPGGTGEFVSLTFEEVSAVLRAAKAEAGDLPVLCGCGYGTAIAIELARQAEANGADGLLLLPQYLIGAEQEGLYRHVKAVCDAVQIGVVIYNRGQSIFQPDTVEHLCEDCPNLIGFKDGHGDIDLLSRICTRLGERLTYIGGMPTAELYAEAYAAIGASTYSSAVYNFTPKLAMDFYRALKQGDTQRVRRLLVEFYQPFAAIRDRRRGYAIAIVKAGLRVVGRSAGPVRAPLIDLSEEEHACLGRLLERDAG